MSSFELSFIFSISFVTLVGIDFVCNFEIYGFVSLKKIVTRMMHKLGVIMIKKHLSFNRIFLSITDRSSTQPNVN